MMKKTRFTKSQIVAAIHKQESGISVKEICRDLGISEPTFYNWKAKYGGMQASDV
jgi:putative transposase